MLFYCNGDCDVLSPADNIWSCDHSALDIIIRKMILLYIIYDILAAVMLSLFW